MTDHTSAEHASSQGRGGLIARTITLTGIVQGVGMRPTVYRHAEAAGIGGWVLNGVGGVRIHAVGTPEQLDTFENLLQNGYPVQAQVETYASEPACLEEDDKPGAFGITTSDDSDGSAVYISPDVATCENCVEELFDPTNRRYRYPFINCTDCGPRFTVIADLPYDRPKTSLAHFPLCPECDFEYHNPADRRFDAQPDACFACGPQLEWIDPTADTHLTVKTGEPYTDTTVTQAHKESDAILAAAVAALKAGKIIAIKGLGGFHLACDATQDATVQLLRARKHRSHKAFAVMVKDLETARAYAQVSDDEAAVLSGTVRPIVLLKKRETPAGSDIPITPLAPPAAHTPLVSQAARAPLAPLAPSVTGELDEVGIMLPYTPLHHLLLHDIDLPLVMTSGNMSDEAIVTSNDQALEQLGEICDAFLLHNRDILARYDDSVVRVIDRTTRIVRRARGIAPYPLKLPASLHDLPCTMGYGPEQKHTFTLTRGDVAFVSQHLGDLEDARTTAAFHEARSTFERLFRITPTHLACDMHPEYLSTKYAQAEARDKTLPLCAVQHHHAHIVAVTAEHNVSDPVIGIALDGTGYGDDGMLWGGEILKSTWTSYERCAHLEPFILPGGIASIKHPARSAYAALKRYGLIDHPGARTLKDLLDVQTAQFIDFLVTQPDRAPFTTSAGRLFDLAAALCGVCADATYEGEPAILFEAAAQKFSGQDRALELASQEWRRYLPDITYDEKGAIVFSLSAPLTALLDDGARGVSAQVRALRFHRALAYAYTRCTQELCEASGISTVALGGGCFMNRLLTQMMTHDLEEAGLTILISEKLPQNDGCISFGQAVVALAHLKAQQGA